MSNKKQKRNGGMLISMARVPPGRIYSDRYAEVWKKAAKLRAGGNGLEVQLGDYEATPNAMRCALVRAKRNGRVPADVRLREGGDAVYLYREAER